MSSESPDTVLSRLGPPITETVLVEGQQFLIRRPSESDRPVDEADGAYIPYWADLWPAARMLAKVIQRESWTPGTEALELGCGLGLPGIVALSQGLKVTFSDFDECALRFATDNARLNGFSDCRTLRLDWSDPPKDMQFPVILAADLIYQTRHAELVAGVIRQMLRPDGMCLLADLERVPSRWLLDALAQNRLRFETQFVRAGEPGGRRWKGTLYRIRR